MLGAAPAIQISDRGGESGTAIAHFAEPAAGWKLRQPVSTMVVIVAVIVLIYYLAR
jgi:hypothetical protein